METYNDELFGKLVYAYYWEGKTTIHIFGETKEIEVSINCDEGEEITENQRQAFIDFKKDEQRICQEAEQAILAYYLSVYEEYQDMLDGNQELIQKKVPTITSIQELSKLVSIDGLFIDYDFSYRIPQRIGLLGECTWEVEHGLAVKIVENQVVETGYQDIII